MGNLLSDRITPSRPFSKVGMDFAGPFLTKPNLPRSPPLLEIPDSNHEGDLQLTSRWHLIQTIKQNLWKRWTRDYLHHLQRKPRCTRLDPELQVGDLVVIHESASPPLAWRLGRIKETYPGPDGLVQVVLIHTQDGDIKRPIVRVTKLISDKLTHAAARSMLNLR
ncbi:hypothetical protein AVEN_8429-1 [Araneus ventricosus]|uniref:DUF5641 domain-containing protein n=1 Tax=Araneus ventricosus TaxID=182803 RepID=A0A4Y2IDP8_ARAVE|nr:hypothetical protein AVEN_8429-1 [Araneus ventricosus]